MGVVTQGENPDFHCASLRGELLTNRAGIGLETKLLLRQKLRTKNPS